MMHLWTMLLEGNKEMEVHGLADIAATKYSMHLPDLKLWAAIIVQQGRDRNISYFSGEGFETHCRILRLNTEDVLDMVKAIWSLEDGDYKQE